VIDIDFQSGDSATLTITPSYEYLPEDFGIAPRITLKHRINTGATMITLDRSAAAKLVYTFRF